MPFLRNLQETEKEKRKEPKEKSKEKNKKTDIATAISKGAREQPSEAEAKTEMQPEAAAANTETKNKNKRLIPIADLPEPLPKIVNAWNSLPLDNKFDGLYPAMLKQVQSLLERYGEEVLLKAIDNVAHSDFLLGKSRNNRGWTISFGWLLNPEHLENILQGKYRNKKPRGESPLFQPGDEEVPYNNGFYGTVVD